MECIGCVIGVSYLLIDDYYAVLVAEDALSVPQTPQLAARWQRALPSQHHLPARVARRLQRQR